MIEDGVDKQVPSPMTPTVDSRVLSLITHAADRQVITLLLAPTIDVIVDDICVVGGASCVRVDIASSRQICRDLSGLALDDQFHKSNMWQRSLRPLPPSYRKILISVGVNTSSKIKDCFVFALIFFAYIIFFCSSSKIF